MNPLMSVRMLWSSHAGWDALSHTHPSSFRSFALIVLPLSLLASAMILYAAWFHAGSYGTQAPFSYWQAVALTFLLTCWLSVHAMAQFIRVAVHTRPRPAYADCYRLAAIAPIPIWLSSLRFVFFSWASTFFRISSYFCSESQGFIVWFNFSIFSTCGSSISCFCA